MLSTRNWFAPLRLSTTFAEHRLRSVDSETGVTVLFAVRFDICIAN